MTSWFEITKLLVTLVWRVTIGAVAGFTVIVTTALLDRVASDTETPNCDAEPTADELLELTCKAEALLPVFENETPHMLLSVGWTVKQLQENSKPT